LDLPDPAIIGNVSFSLEVAAADTTLALGPSNRTLLGQDSGMLFVFPEEDVATFWMRDMMFIERNGSIVDIQTMRTQRRARDDQLTQYHSTGPVIFALEIHAGLAEQFGFQPGMVIQFE
jgi:uncharacterized membrane protein (UPF0127 family)